PGHLLHELAVGVPLWQDALDEHEHGTARAKDTEAPRQPIDTARRLGALSAVHASSETEVSRVACPDVADINSSGPSRQRPARTIFVPGDRTSAAARECSRGGWCPEPRALRPLDTCRRGCPWEAR